MSAVTASQMRQLEDQAFSRGIEAGSLMDEAGKGLARWLLDHFPQPGRAIAFIGKGKNGGDALVVLDQLRRAGWTIALRASHPTHEWTTLARQRLRRLGIEPDQGLPAGPGPLILLDGLLGIGARGALREPLDALAEEMSRLRNQAGGIVVAIDLPSGLNADDGSSGGLVADITLTLGAPKIGLLQDVAARYCGRLGLIPLAGLPMPDQPGLELTTPALLSHLSTPRPHDFHKGDAGRVRILAGSPGMSGAATLASHGALRAGAGLITLFLDPENPATPLPEVMTKRLSKRIPALFEDRCDARVIGPGLGRLTAPQAEALLEGLAQDTTPTVLDADALNLLAGSDRLDLLRSHHLITPHPGEFARLAPDLAGLLREEAATRFVDRHPCTLLLKGTRTLIATAGRNPRINPTGHAGMASGGQGDVLSGVCGALLAGGLCPLDAGSWAAWLCGRAAERAITHGGESEESCTATHTIDHLGGAFRDWREQRR
ncbi:NAD(P)H-hydrate dehydratase [Haloferula rosea]|uniref:Bifunctional NAD(P)H-hydrate repair enzyme n=1 Tax=Haloferula rosea TaxID=490093 RepID=A0A934VHF8_9BACT|nr:NAD(P)H-hydrate dehydratase [Haloferula rosea]MBK1828620.1 NAD(P)H-hydrate dehydratase [Haloferula rosea]